MKSTEIHIGKKYIIDKWCGREANAPAFYSEEKYLYVATEKLASGKWLFIRYGETVAGTGSLEADRDIVHSRHVRYTEAEWRPVREAKLLEIEAERLKTEADNARAAALTKEYEGVLSQVMDPTDIKRLKENRSVYVWWDINEFAALIDAAVLNSMALVEAE